MHDPQPPSRPPRNGLRWVLIAGTIVVAGGAFAYVGGRLTPHRLTAQRLVDVGGTEHEQEALALHNDHGTHTHSDDESSHCR